MAKKREEKHAQLELRVYNTAIDMFCYRGYQNTTLKDIAEACEISTRTLYRYYPTKSSILFRFARENIMALKDYASELDQGWPLKDRVVSIMLKDFEQMFCMFDPSYILHCGRSEEDGLYNRFEIENILETRSIYANVFKHEQLKYGIVPNNQTILCAQIICALYRQCNDIFRFKIRTTSATDAERLDTLRSYYLQHLDIIWDGIYDALLHGSDQPIAGERIGKNPR